MAQKKTVIFFWGGGQATVNPPFWGSHKMGRLRVSPWDAFASLFAVGSAAACGLTLYHFARFLSPNALVAPSPSSPSQDASLALLAWSISKRLVADVLLLLAFGLQHSCTKAEFMQSMWPRKVSDLHRSAYVLATAVSLQASTHQLI